jgi:nitroimidazol reductase NimA-like FMN-containing flavoprotein (pyridoxamine 5'-phosphate oxidase superfamily)
MINTTYFTDRSRALSPRHRAGEPSIRSIICGIVVAMTTKAPSPTPHEQTRADNLLREAAFAYVAVVEESRPYVVPMNFAYEPATSGTTAHLYLHTGAGRKSAALANNPRICVTVAAETAFEQGPSPCKDGFSFRSVVVEGSAALLDDPAEREAALRAIVAKYDAAAAAAPFSQAALAKTLVYTVTIDALTYKERPRR